MGRKKHQNAANEADSVVLDVVEIEKSTDLPKLNCQHVTRSVELDHIKKTLKSENLKTIACTICRKEGVAPKKEENWVCLQCGARQCSLEHLKNHFNVPRSDSHTVAFSLNNFTIWCEQCNSFLREDESRKLKVCVGYIKQMMDKSKQVQIVETPYNDDVPPPLVDWNESNDTESAKPNVINKKNYNQRPSVRGLVNLGNTCFFNSVLQCLARTPKLVETLRRMESDEEHISITLRDGQRLEGALGKSGDWLGQCLADILVALCRPGDTSSENPLKLLQLLRKKCPQFEGYDQHDAHELLRHLLDNVRQNDLKRYRALMLSELGLSRKVNPQDVSPELTKKVKALDNQVVDKVTLVPEHVFKGLLVSTLECQDCRHTSHCVESFLDLSLPIMADKPQPPSIRRKGSASPELVDEKVSGGLSKYQQKKQAKQARKKTRNKHGQKSSVIAAADGILPAAVDSHSDKGESEADVEDNEEDKPHESGYSSEKIQSESSSLSGGDDSARTSPTTHAKEERISSNARVTVCEGLPSISAFSTGPSSGLIATPSYEPSPRIKRKPPANWIGGGGSLTPAWIPHSDSTCIPNPQQVIDGGQSWKSYVPREGLPPCSGRTQKDSLNPIVEECDRNNPSELIKAPESSVCDQVSLMSKVVETVLAQVHIRQEDLHKYEHKKVTELSDSCVIRTNEGGTRDCIDDRIPNIKECCKAGGDINIHCKETERLPNDESSSNVDKIHRFCIDNSQNNHSNNISSQNETVVDSPTDPVNSLRSNVAESNVECNEVESTCKDVDNTVWNSEVSTTYRTVDEVCNKSETVCEVKTENQMNNSPQCVTEDTSNGFHIDSLYNRKNNSQDEDEKKDSDNDPELNLTPLLNDCSKPSTTYKENSMKKVDKKDDTESVRMRRRRMLEERDALSNRQETESECSVQSCLSQFTAVEIMSGANKVGCSVCTQRHNKGNKEGKTVYTMASKQLLIKSVPQVLILHLKRFQVQMYSFRKLSKHVSFPLYLDLSPFCLQEVERDDDGKIMYGLYGVVEHSGNLNGGHYVAYIKVEDEQNSRRWFCISDSYVHEVSENRVLQTQAYLLFYKRLPNHYEDESS